jgi:hypothetical protein
VRRSGALVAALAAASLLGTGCGDDSATSDAARVERYIQQVNAVQTRDRAVVERLNENLKAYAGDKLKGREAELRLLTSEADLARAKGRVAALTPPPAARKLRRLLLTVYDMDIALAGETRRTAAYVPRAERTLNGLDDVRRRLRKDLRAARVPRRQIAALRGYADRLLTAQVSLAALDVPPVLAATHTAQIERLRETRRLALLLAGSIKRQDAAAVARQLKAFRNAGGPDPVTDLRALGSIRAYGQRVAQVGSARTAVVREQSRLLARKRS